MRAAHDGLYRDERSGRYFCSQAGGSMRPTLRGRNLLEIEPYDGRPIRPGDVVLFSEPGGEALVAHRVTSVDEAGIHTRGDSAGAADPWILGRDAIIGRVTATWRGRRRVPVIGGPLGLLLARLPLPLALRLFHELKAPLALLLAPLRGSITRRLRPRVIAINDELRLEVGGRVVGRYDARRGCWRIRPPFNLVIDAKGLPVS